MTNMMSIEEFQVVEAYKDKGINIPKRATKWSAGYDLESAEDIIIPSIFKQLKSWEVDRKDMSDNIYMMWKSICYFDKTHDITEPKSITEIKQIVKSLNLVTMVPTGLKICMESDKYLAIHPRSSMGVNCLLMLANQTGIVDADYYNNEDNEGHIFVPMINLSPYDIKINKGDRIAQGIIQRYTTLDYNGNDYIDNDRIGGCGSTGVKAVPGGTYNPDNYYFGLDGTIKNIGSPIATFKDNTLAEKVTVDHLYRPDHTTYTTTPTTIGGTTYKTTTVPPNRDLSELAQISTKDYEDSKTIVTAHDSSNE